MNILTIEDDRDALPSLRHVLEEDGHFLEAAETLAEAFQRDDLPAFSIILLDRNLPDGIADKHLPRLKALAPNAVVIIIASLAEFVGEFWLR